MSAIARIPAPDIPVKIENANCSRNNIQIENTKPVKTT